MRLVKAASTTHLFRHNDSWMNFEVTEIMHLLWWSQDFPPSNLMSEFSSCIAMSTYRHPHRHITTACECQNFKERRIYLYFNVSLVLGKKPIIITQAGGRGGNVLQPTGILKKKKNKKNCIYKQTIYCAMICFYGYHHHMETTPLSFLHGHSFLIAQTTDTFIHLHHRCKYVSVCARATANILCSCSEH